MNKIWALLLLLSLFSCKKVDAVLFRFFGDSEIVEETIDYSSIDFYPLFKNCKSISFEESKLCFERTIYEQLKTPIDSLVLTTEKSITDTITIKITVNSEGVFSCKEVMMRENLPCYFPDFSKKIKEIVHDLPKVIPAQKRGIPVVSNYTIPLILEVE